MIFTPIFTYLLSNILIIQVSQTYQKLLSNNIMACERSLVKIIELLQKEGKIDEIESLLNCLEMHPNRINLSEVYKLIFIQIF